MRPRWSVMELEEIWQACLMSLWERAVLPSAYESCGHAVNAAAFAMWKGDTRTRAGRRLRGSVVEWLGLPRRAALIAAQRPDPALHPFGGAGFDTISAEGVGCGQMQEAWRCFESLNPKRRVAVELLLFGRLGASKSAELLGCRTNTLLGNFKQGVEELRRRFRGGYVDRWGVRFDPVASSVDSRKEGL